MNSTYASKLIKKMIWPDFTAHFKSDTTKASYRTDITEIMEYFKKDFLEIGKEEIQEYFIWMKQRIEQGQLSPGTVAKKFRELHSFADYICINRERYKIEGEYVDEYYPYLKLVAKQEKFARSVPVEHMDQLLKAAEQDLMAYCILILLYRVGITSTEIIELRLEDLAIYEDGMYLLTGKRKNQSFVPEDAAVILGRFVQERMDHSHLFYNKRGNQLNIMYVSRMMKKYTTKAGIPAYSAENVRNTCGVTLFAYGGNEKQVAQQMGITQIQIKRYKNMAYRENLQKEASKLVKLKVEPPE